MWRSWDNFREALDRAPDRCITGHEAIREFSNALSSIVAHQPTKPMPWVINVWHRDMLLDFDRRLADRFDRDHYSADPVAVEIRTRLRLPLSVESHAREQLMNTVIGRLDVVDDELWVAHTFLIPFLDRGYTGAGAELKLLLSAVGYLERECCSRRKRPV